LANDSAVPVKTALGHGKAGAALAELAVDLDITHVVMTSHGRTGMSRAIAGDVAADLIERLSVPIVVIPSLTAESRHNSDGRTVEKTAPAGSLS
jgi:nucleotide-binding universal stress UspA family protein